MRGLLTSFILVQIMLIPCFLMVSEDIRVCCLGLAWMVLLGLLWRTNRGKRVMRKAWRLCLYILYGREVPKN